LQGRRLSRSACGGAWHALAWGCNRGALVALLRVLEILLVLTIWRGFWRFFWFWQFGVSLAVTASQLLSCRRWNLASSSPVRTIGFSAQPPLKQHLLSYFIVPVVEFSSSVGFNDSWLSPLLLGPSRPHGGHQNVIARDWLAPATTMSSKVALWSLLVLLLSLCSKRSKFHRPGRGVLQALRFSSQFRVRVCRDINQSLEIPLVLWSNLYL